MAWSGLIVNQSINQNFCIIYLLKRTCKQTLQDRGDDKRC